MWVGDDKKESRSTILTQHHMNCPYCNSAGHDEERQTCPQRAADASRWSRGGKEAYPVVEYLFDALATVALPCGGREVTGNPVRVMLAAKPAQCPLPQTTGERTN